MSEDFGVYQVPWGEIQNAIREDTFWDYLDECPQIEFDLPSTRTLTAFAAAYQELLGLQPEEKEPTEGCAPNEDELESEDDDEEDSEGEGGLRAPTTPEAAYGEDEDDDDDDYDSMPFYDMDEAVSEEEDEEDWDSDWGEGSSSLDEAAVQGLRKFLEGFLVVYLDRPGETVNDLPPELRGVPAQFAASPRTVTGLRKDYESVDWGAFE
ncbi:MAG: hypothetical protein AAF517_21920, partial [Planctomycetota bacterium]